MKITKIILTTIMIVVAALGLFRILPFNITNSIMFTSLATLLLLRSIEWKKSRDKTGFLFTFIAAVFIYIVVIFNICSSLLGYEKVDNRDCLKDINPSEIVEIKCSGTTGGKDGHFEYFLDERQQEDFVELLGKVKLGRKAERSHGSHRAETSGSRGRQGDCGTEVRTGSSNSGGCSPTDGRAGRKERG